jgi:hypothetical protein
MIPSDLLKYVRSNNVVALKLERVKGRDFMLREMLCEAIVCGNYDVFKYISNIGGNLDDELFEFALACKSNAIAIYIYNWLDHTEPRGELSGRDLVVGVACMDTSNE